MPNGQIGEDLLVPAARVPEHAERGFSHISDPGMGRLPCGHPHMPPAARWARGSLASPVGRGSRVRHRALQRSLPRPLGSGVRGRARIASSRPNKAPHVSGMARRSSSRHMLRAAYRHGCAGGDPSRVRATRADTVVMNFPSGGQPPPGGDKPIVPRRTQAATMPTTPAPNRMRRSLFPSLSCQNPPNPTTTTGGATIITPNTTTAWGTAWWFMSWTIRALRKQRSSAAMADYAHRQT